MDFPIKQRGALWILIGVLGIYFTFKRKDAGQQMDFDPISDQERINEKATRLKRNLWIVADVGLIAYGLYLLIL
jgi:hypothetical protein